MTAVRQLSWVEFRLYLGLLSIIQGLGLGCMLKPPSCIHDLTYSDTVTGCTFQFLTFLEALLEVGLVTHT